jgi:biotin-dependent carboxylase-like uncharacterized protein
MTNAHAALAIVDAGLQATIQDRGRRHVGQIGVSPSGFADWLSARAANRLVGNKQGAPLIETTLTGCEFLTMQRLRVAVTGASAMLTVNGVERPMWQALLVPSGANVKLEPPERGLRSYIAFFGGIDVPLVLGSASTDMVAGFGGLNGRALARGDTLKLIAREGDLPENDACVAPWLWPMWRQPATLRVLPGPHAKDFSLDDIAFFQGQTYRVSPRSSRQGVRLEGHGLRVREGYDMLSAGVCAGCVQLSSDGLPIILLAEHQTTGGYAVPLTVISADIPDAAQLRPSDQVRFRLVVQSEAAVALTEKMKILAHSLHESDS